MKNLMTMSQCSDRTFRLSPSGSTRARRQLGPVPSVTHRLEAPGHETVLADDRTRGLASLGNACGQARPIVEGLWFYTPKFSNNYHFQRWRCAT